MSSCTCCQCKSRKKLGFAYAVEHEARDDYEKLVKENERLRKALAEMVVYGFEVLEGEDGENLRR